MLSLLADIFCYGKSYMYPVVTFRKFWAVHNYNDGSDHPGLPERHYSGKMVGQRYNG